MTDADLVRASQAGDKAALEALYDRHLPLVWRYACARLGGDVHMAEDVVSETFLTAVRGMGKFDPERGSIGAWIIGIARHKVQDHFRRKGRRASSESSKRNPEVSAAGADPPALAQAAETRALIAAVVDKLADEERLALEWKYLDDLSVREIASRLGRTEKAAEALVFRARRSFRTLMEKHKGATDDCRE